MTVMGSICNLKELGLKESLVKTKSRCDELQFPSDLS